jgi:TorA-specific chaperone
MVDVSTAVVSRNRAALYHWFSLAFIAPPEAAQVTSLQQGQAHELLLSLQSFEAATGAIQAMQQVLDSGPAGQVTASLQAAHARLFDGAGGFDAAPPYRSIYTSERGLLYQQATADMQGWLQQLQLGIASAVHEPADHLALQLEVMSELALRLAAVQERDADPDTGAHVAQQVGFLDTQLLNWVALFAQRLAEVDALGFHAGLAALLVVVLQQDRAYLTGG